MNSVRRALFLVMFASVLAAEPTHARALAGSTDPAGLPAAQATVRWVRRLAATLQLAVEPAPAAETPSFRDTDVCRPITGPQVARVHPAREPHAFRLPPPLRQG